MRVQYLQQRDTVSIAYMMARLHDDHDRPAGLVWSYGDTSPVIGDISDMPSALTPAIFKREELEGRI